MIVSREGNHEPAVATPPIQLHDPAEIARRIADGVRAERLRRGWKQETLSVRSGVSLPTVRRYERTGRTSIQNLLKLCLALDRLDEFFEIMAPPRASTLDELEARAAATTPARKRGNR